MTIPEDVKKFAPEGFTIKKLDKQFDGYDVYHIFKENAATGYPFIVLKKGNDCIATDLSDEKYKSIWTFL